MGTRESKFYWRTMPWYSFEKVCQASTPLLHAFAHIAQPEPHAIDVTVMTAMCMGTGQLCRGFTLKAS